MRVALMQPYFFPYVGYFTLLKHTDRFIAFDTAQYLRSGWMNRNRILNVNDGFSYINVPIVKAPQKTPMKEILINNQENWQRKLLDKLVVYRRIAPYYDNVISFLKECLSKKFDYLVELNIATLKSTCDYLNIQFIIDKFSDLELQENIDCQPDDWGVLVCNYLRASNYVNAFGGSEFYDRNKYIENDINITFLKNNLTEYRQKSTEFRSGLSIIDLMMFNSKEDINRLIDDFIEF